MASIEDIYERLSFGLHEEEQTRDPIRSVVDLRFQYLPETGNLDLITDRDPRIQEINKVSGHNLDHL